ncbi:unnamed protein product, partial [Nesidiocoris tenuis]
HLFPFDFPRRQIIPSSFPARRLRRLASVWVRPSRPVTSTLRFWLFNQLSPSPIGCKALSSSDT